VTPTAVFTGEAVEGCPGRDPQPANSPAALRRCIDREIPTAASARCVRSHHARRGRTLAAAAGPGVPLHMTSRVLWALPRSVRAPRPGLCRLPVDSLCLPTTPRALGGAGRREPRRASNDLHQGGVCATSRCWALGCAPSPASSPRRSSMPLAYNWARLGRRPHNARPQNLSEGLRPTSRGRSRIACPRPWYQPGLPSEVRKAGLDGWPSWSSLPRSTASAIGATTATRIPRPSPPSPRQPAPTIDTGHP